MRWLMKPVRQPSTATWICTSGAGRLQHLLEAIGLDRKARPIGSNVVNTINGKPPQVFSPLRERLLDTVIEVPAGAAE